MPRLVGLALSQSVALATALPLSGPQLPHVWLGDFERFIKNEMK